MGNKISYIFHRLAERLSDFKSVFTGSWMKRAAVLSACVVLLLGGFLLWNNVLSPDARKGREDAQKIVEFINNVEFAKERQRNDTFGGKTPEETLQLFIAALEADDLELASKYFVLNALGERDSKWLDGLTEAKELGNISRLIGDLKKAERVSYSESLGSSVLSVKNNGLEIGSILLERNSFSGLWKISGL